jgi:hypothetical protein
LIHQLLLFARLRVYHLFYHSSQGGVPGSS